MIIILSPASNVTILKSFLSSPLPLCWPTAVFFRHHIILSDFQQLLDTTLSSCATVWLSPHLSTLNGQVTSRKKDTVPCAVKPAVSVDINLCHYKENVQRVAFKDLSFLSLCVFGCAHVSVRAPCACRSQSKPADSTGSPGTWLWAGTSALAAELKSSVRAVSVLDW